MERKLDIIEAEMLSGLSEYCMNTELVFDCPIINIIFNKRQEHFLIVLVIQ